MGLIPRAIEEIFQMVDDKKITEFQVHCSFVQIYNENLYDMLRSDTPFPYSCHVHVLFVSPLTSPPFTLRLHLIVYRDASMNSPLSIREDNKEIYVQGLSEYNVKGLGDTLNLLKIAEENRAIRETHMNLFSSRSHSIFTIQVESKRVAEDGGEVSYRAKFNLVDLAGSEKWNTKQQMRDEHIAEMNNINLSLHTLGKCISALAEYSRRRNRESKQLDKESRDRDMFTSLAADGPSTRSQGSLDVSMSTNGSAYSLAINRTRPSSTATAHIPFRESKLTRLLQDSLGGNAKTYLIATVSPAR